MTYLLLDFGASRVKSGVYETAAGVVNDVRATTSCEPCANESGRYEVSVADLARQFRTIVDSYRREYILDGIMICSEMHGFAVIGDSGKFLGNYISWRDSRDAHAGGGVFSALKKIMPPDEYLKTTGMLCSPTLPLVNLISFMKTQNVSKARVVALPELLAVANGSFFNLSHSSMAAGLGVYDIHAKSFSEKLVSFAEEQTGTALAFGNVTDDVVVAGEYDGIPIYSGIGDLQAAVYGAGNGPDTISVNLGTGSQVSLVDGKSSNDNLEVRPFLNGLMMQTITHIPSGRMLNCYVGFLNDVAPLRDVWGLLATVTNTEMTAAQLDFGLGVFPGAWGGSGSGGIVGIMEGRLTLRNYIASLLKAYVGQYAKAISAFGDVRGRRIVLSGGIAAKLPVVGERLSMLTGLNVHFSQNSEETLDGLARLVDVL